MSAGLEESQGSEDGAKRPTSPAGGQGCQRPGAAALGRVFPRCLSLNCAIPTTDADQRPVHGEGVAKGGGSPSAPSGAFTGGTGAVAPRVRGLTPPLDKRGFRLHNIVIVGSAQ